MAVLCIFHTSKRVGLVQASTCSAEAGYRNERLTIKCPRVLVSEIDPQTGLTSVDQLVHVGLH